MHAYGDTFIPVIPVEDETLHSLDTPFCWESTCPCHEDATLIAEVAEAVIDGLLTPREATDFVAGRMV